MAFVNELIPPIEQEISEFARQARKTLNTGHSQFDTWTIDREREMVLFKDGSGHSLDSHDEDWWSFIDKNGRYSVDTKLLSKVEISSEEIAITRRFHCQGGGIMTYQIRKLFLASKRHCENTKTGEWNQITELADSRS